MGNCEKTINQLPMRTMPPTKIIIIQGCSSSGKSTLATYIHQKLMNNNISCTLIGCDSFYKTFPLEYTLENLSRYDFDNPAALNWDAIKETLDAYARNDVVVPEYRYSFVTKISEKKFVKNVFPKVIILEGIYSFNLFNKEVFNLAELDATDSNKTLVDEFIGNDYSIPTFSALKIQMLLPKELMRSVRVARDLKERKFNCLDDMTDTILKNQIIERFETKLWPATQRWVYSNKNQADIVIEKGTFNPEKCDKVCNDIFLKMGLSTEEDAFRNNLKTNRRALNISQLV